MKAGKSLARLLGAALLLLCTLPTPARADVVLLIEEPINLLAHIAATGHSAILITTLCSDDHLHFRECRPGESGSVLGRYQGLADKYDWLAMPPEAYLYAESSPAQPPASITADDAAALRTLYSRGNPFPGAIQPGPKEWVQLTGQSYRRRIFCLRVHTTHQQDLRLAAWLDHTPNRTRYSFLFNNCADFSRRILDVLFPGAIHRNFLFDAGLTTPKQLAAGLHRYARTHPELDYTVEVLPQVPGPIRRSGHIRGVTESFVKTTPYLMPLAYLNPVPWSLVIGSGLLDHRYNLQKLAATAPPFSLLPHSEDTPEEPASGQVSGPISGQVSRLR